MISDAVYENLSKAIQYPTISFIEDAIPDSTAFTGFINSSMTLSLLFMSNLL
ncbi:hypothetical protein [Maribacter sp. ACAM166]|uniref:hypothetical protein n=1 Tax=Maribacter sp. ACAM166 TaxID=2508996 RepID=UPI0014852031|nr:hypothetical protein [Maribacter sp. ACAM166]